MFLILSPYSPVLLLLFICRQVAFHRLDPHSDFRWNRSVRVTFSAMGNFWWDKVSPRWNIRSKLCKVLLLVPILEEMEKTFTVLVMFYSFEGLKLFWVQQRLRKPWYSEHVDRRHKVLSKDAEIHYLECQWLIKPRWPLGSLLHFDCWV